jgi:hypothetical protein
MLDEETLRDSRWVTYLPLISFISLPIVLILVAIGAAFGLF